MIVKTDVVILSSIKYGDSSRILRVYSRDYGKISIIIKGAISSKNRYGSAIEPLSISEIQFYFKKNTDLYLVSSAETKVNLKNVRNNLDRIAIGMMILESISQSHEEKDKNEMLFDEIVSSLEILNTIEFSPVIALIYFEIKHSLNLGFDINFNFLDLNRSDLNNEILYFSLFDTSIAKNFDIIKGKSIKLNG
ncbi:MAG: DNA repair protein RecO [Candidatus Kapabacteria bacterium]|nr:DNA repair protein RecO [Candidatus Kapabacteria bacterium]